MSQTVTIGTIAEAMGIDRTTAMRLAKKEFWFNIPDVPKTGGKRFLYPIGALPAEIHAKVVALLAEQELARVQAADPDSLRAIVREKIESGTKLPRDIAVALCERELAADAPALPAAEPNSLPTTHLSDDQRRCAEARMALLAEIDRLAHAAPVKVAIQQLCDMAATGKLARHLIPLIPIANARSGEGRTLSTRTLKRWRALRKSGGFSALAPLETTREKAAPWWAAGLLRHYQKPQKPALTEALRLYTAELQALNLEPPSYSQAASLIKALGTVERNRGRMGPRELKTLKPYVKRDDSDLNPLDIVLMDGHQYDAEIAHPLHGAPFRPEITTVIDAKTRMALGFSLGLAESAQAIMDALRDAVLRWGVPAILYTDRGSGNLAEVVSAPVIGLLARLGTQHEKSIAYNSQARGRSERAHATIWVASAKQRPTYIGKPMDAQAKQVVHKLTRRDLMGKGAALLPAWRDFVADCKREVADYNNRPHRSLPTITDPVTGKRRNQSPMEAWAAAVAGGWAPEMLPASVADDLFRPHRVATVHRAIVTLQNLEYAHPDLQEFHGERVQVAYEPTDEAFVWVKTMEGRFICKAPLDGHKRDFMPKSIKAQAQESRTKAAIKRLESHAETARAELRGPAIEMEVANLEQDLQLVRPAELIEFRPRQDPQHAEFEVKSRRFARWKELEALLAAGGDVSEADRRWHLHYSRDPECTSRVRMEAMVAEGRIAG